MTATTALTTADIATVAQLARQLRVDSIRASRSRSVKCAGGVPKGEPPCYW